MRLTDVRHFLDTKGAIRKEVPDFKFTEFIASLIWATTIKGTTAQNPLCFNCSSYVTSVVAHSGQIVWQCNCCTEEGIISNWQDTFWDMTDKTSINLS